MKMTRADYEELKSAILPVDTAKARAERLVKGHSETRYCWDLFWKSEGWIERSKRFYEYLNDRNIETALKDIVKNHNPTQSP